MRKPNCGEWGSNSSRKLREVRSQGMKRKLRIFWMNRRFAHSWHFYRDTPVRMWGIGTLTVCWG